jgi:hypothetical protein
MDMIVVLMPEVVPALEELKGILLPWLMTSFMNSSIPDIMRNRILDWLFHQGSISLFKLILAVIKKNKEALSHCDEMGQASEILKGFLESLKTEKDMDEILHEAHFSYGIGHDLLEDSRQFRRAKFVVEWTKRQRRDLLREVQPLVHLNNLDLEAVYNFVRDVQLEQFGVTFYITPKTDSKVTEYERFKINEHLFKMILQIVFPLGGGREVAEGLLRLLDVKDGLVDFLTFAQVLDMVAQGDLERKLKLLFAAFLSIPTVEGDAEEEDIMAWVEATRKWLLGESDQYHYLSCFVCLNLH